MTSPQPRKPAGTSDGGKFATVEHPEGDATLGAERYEDDPAWETALERSTWFRPDGEDGPDEAVAREMIDRWRETRAAIAAVAGPDPEYIYFTSAHDARAIVVTGQLFRSQTVEGAVFGVLVGARSVPGVQHANQQFTVGPMPVGREVAVTFRCNHLPDTAFPEEVSWRRSSGTLAIRPGRIVTADEADALLDGSLPIPDDGF